MSLDLEVAFRVTGEDSLPGPEPEPGDNAIRLVNRSGAPQPAWPFQFARAFAPGEIAHEPQLTIDGLDATAQVNVLCRWPDGSVKHAHFAVVLNLSPDGAPTLGFRDSAPARSGAGGGRRPRGPSKQTLLDDYDFEAVIEFSTPEGLSEVSARDMLAADHYQVIYPGSVAETLMLGDDSAARTYDIGFPAQHGEARPLRPRFYATFWSQTGQVELRAVVESAAASELADSLYTAEIWLGETDTTRAYTLDLSGASKTHWAMTAWTKRFWTGATEPPAAEVDIDWGQAYLARHGFLPNMDSALEILPALPPIPVGEPYDGQWNGHLLQNGMSVAGARGEIGPLPLWQCQAVYPKADWQIREVMLACADQAASWPCHIREDQTGKRLNREDDEPDGGYGRVMSITDRPTMTTAQLSYGYTKPEDRVVFLGGSQPPQPVWSFDGAHQPQLLYVPYLVGGDPWCLREMYFWAAFSAALYNGAAPTVSYGRGPTGAEGPINDQLRGGGWVLRNRCEAAFIAPDADPEKAYFTTLAHDALARWEGSLGIAGTPYDGHPVKEWGAATGNFYSGNGGPQAGQAPPLGYWESNGNPNGRDATIINNVAGGVFATRGPSAAATGSIAEGDAVLTIASGGPAAVGDMVSGLSPTNFVQEVAGDGAYKMAYASYSTVEDAPLTIYPPAVAGSFTSPWMEWFKDYGLGRAAELGFPAEPLTAAAGRFICGLINESGYPKLISMYQMPTERNAVASGETVLTVPPGGMFADWPEMLATITTAYLTGEGWGPAGNNGEGWLDEYFARHLNDEGYPMQAMPALALSVDRGAPGAAEAWAWFLDNVYRPVMAKGINNNPRWAIIPRAHPTGLPPIAWARRR